MGWTKLTFRCLPVVHETKRDSWRELPVLIRDPLKRSGEWENAFHISKKKLIWFLLPTVFLNFIFFLFSFLPENIPKIWYMAGIYGIRCRSVRDLSAPAFIPTDMRHAGRHRQPRRAHSRRRQPFRVCLHGPYPLLGRGGTLADIYRWSIPRQSERESHGTGQPGFGAPKSSCTSSLFKTNIGASHRPSLFYLPSSAMVEETRYRNLIVICIFRIKIW